MDADVIVIGAGIAGLQCARRLADAGRSVLVLDRARGVGGRCATRRVEGQPVDLGPLFLHGHQPAFLAAVDEVEGVTRLGGWPHRVRGSGKPCQPDAFAPGEYRVIFAEGLAAFPRHLAAGLDVRLGANVEAVERAGSGWAVRVAGRRDPLSSTDLVLAMALEQSTQLLDGLGDDDPDLRTTRALMAMFGSLPCLTVVALYEPPSTPLDFDVWYPAQSKVLSLIGNDSSKRRAAPRLALVFQAQPRWSREHLDDLAAAWERELLAEAATLLGEWAARPVTTSTHRWSYARVDRGNELTSPLLWRAPGGGRLGIAGDIFAPGGGVQAAWLSGERLARRMAMRLIDEE